MFVALLKYIRPLEEVDAHVHEHARFLDAQYASGVFLASGRRVPRTGAVIIARVASKEELEDILARDPYIVHGVAEFEIVEFIATKTTPELAYLREPL